MKTPTTNLQSEAKIFLGGEYQVQIVNQDGSVTYPIGEKFHKNVITDIGIDKLHSKAYGDGNAHTANDWIGRGGDSVLYYCRVGSGSTAASSTDQNLESQLSNPAPTSTMFTGSGGCLSVLTDVPTLGRATHKWTFQFAAATGSATINEIGLGWAMTGNTLFSRFVTPTPIVLTDGQQLRVAYQLTISMPCYLTATSISGLTSNGFNVSGTSPNKGIRICGSASDVFGSVLNNGMFYDTGYLFPLMTSDMGYNQGSFTLGSGTSFGSVGSLPANYGDIVIPGAVQHYASRSVVGNGAGVYPKYIDRIVEFGISSPSETVSNVSGFHIFAGSATLSWLFDSPQTKSNEYKLRIGVRTSFARA